MQKIVPHLWFDREAKEASSFYTSLFPDSKVISVRTITGTPSGDCDIISFKLAGKDFMSISAGPVFKLNPSVSLFVAFESETEIEEVWSKLRGGGKVLMAYDTYPWAHKYGWLEDRYGLSWQLSFSDNHKLEQKITPLLMFTKELLGKAKEAIETYMSIFPDSKTDMLVPFGPGEGGVEGHIKHARFSLCGQNFMAMDGGTQHDFIFNEAFSFIVNCESQEEVDFYWDKLSAHPEAEQCGWLKDRFGVSWQIVPTAMNQMLSSGTPEQVTRVTQAFLHMKKFDIAALEKAFAE